MNDICDMIINGIKITAVWYGFMMDSSDSDTIWAFKKQNKPKKRQSKTKQNKIKYNIKNI